VRTAENEPWWRELTGYHWLVLVIAILGWLFDAMDQYLFVLARDPALKDLLPNASPAERTSLGSKATALFIVGWATGGLIFGFFSDRWGRTRALMATILVYSLFTGLSALSQSWWDFALYRFLCGLGIGGEWAAGVALVAEVLPARARPHALGLVQAFSSFGAITGAALSLAIPPQGFVGPLAGWRVLFLLGVLPGLLVVVIRLRVRESDRWLQARARSKPDEEKTDQVTPAQPEKRLGDVREIFGDRRWRYHTLIGMTLGMVGQIGVWGISLFTPELIRGTRLEQRRELLPFQPVPTERDGTEEKPPQNLDQLARRVTASESEATALAGQWKKEDDRLVSWGILLFNVGAFFGGYLAPQFAMRFGRRPAFLLGFLAGLGATWFTFSSLYAEAQVYWMMPLLGFCTCAVFAVYAVYFPELYPTRLRSTGAGFCYNVARYFTAIGATTVGSLTLFFAQLEWSEPLRPAAMSVALIYLVGMAVVPFAPETRGKPLPD
jgi:MFS family permease